DCVVSETGDLGSHGETGRSIAAAPGVSPAADGLSAVVKIRDLNGAATLVHMSNTYTLGGIVVEKTVHSSNDYAVDPESRTAPFEFELVCEAHGITEAIVRTFTLSDGEQYEASELPDGARCSLSETNARGALDTAITVAGDTSQGATRE